MARRRATGFPARAGGRLSGHGGGDQFGQPWQHENRQDGTADQLHPPELRPQLGFQPRDVSLHRDDVSLRRNAAGHAVLDRRGLTLSRRNRAVAMVSKGTSVIRPAVTGHSKGI